MKSKGIIILYVSKFLLHYLLNSMNRLRVLALNHWSLMLRTQITSPSSDAICLEKLYRSTTRYTVSYARGASSLFAQVTFLARFKPGLYQEILRYGIDSPGAWGASKPAH